MKRLIPLLLLVALCNADDSFLSHRRKAFRPAAVAGGTLDSPDDIASLYAWWRADDLDATLANGDNVTAWNDATANGHNLSAALTRYPVFFADAINGHDYVDFQAADVLTNGTFELPQPFTIMAVTSITNASGIGLWMVNPPADVGFYKNSSHNHLMMAGSSLTDGPVVEAWHLITMVFTNGGSILRTNMTQAISGNTGTKGFTNIWMGAKGSDGTLPVSAKIAEIAVWATNLNGSDLTAMEQYFTNKYAITW